MFLADESPPTLFLSNSPEALPNTLHLDSITQNLITQSHLWVRENRGLIFQLGTLLLPTKSGFCKGTKREEWLLGRRPAVSGPALLSEVDSPQLCELSWRPLMLARITEEKQETNKETLSRAEKKVSGLPHAGCLHASSGHSSSRHHTQMQKQQRWKEINSAIVSFSRVRKSSLEALR